MVLVIAVYTILRRSFDIDRTSDTIGKSIKFYIEYDVVRTNGAAANTEFDKF